MKKQPLIGKSHNELKEIVAELSMPSFTAKQITEWIYKKKIGSIDEMTNISAKNREILAEKYEVGCNKPIQVAESSDGTKKYLFQTEEGHYIETVYIPEDDRATLCVSIQVGCKMNCLFCMTGKQGFNGQLSPTEVINQIISIPETDKLTNIVFMGMGEPFDNMMSLLQSLEIITSSYGFGWSPRRVTVSSIGIIPGMKVFLDKSDCHLAISLHSPFHEERERLMPMEKVYPIEKVIAELKKYDFSHQRRLSFEYIMFEGTNDSIRHAVELVKLLKGLDCRLNLIRFHEIPGIDLKSSNPEKIEFFRNYLSNNGIITTIRRSRGENIQAACGMLSTKEKLQNNANSL
ncbi:MAG: rRNA m(2)A-2503 methyltransferase [Bacteroidetes bacterium]|nr:rRNA m(2)A-2503 methyltransferase [Bacteroidota bacterium]